MVSINQFNEKPLSENVRQSPDGFATQRCRVWSAGLSIDSKVVSGAGLLEQYRSEYPRILQPNALHLTRLHAKLANAVHEPRGSVHRKALMVVEVKRAYFVE